MSTERNYNKEFCDALLNHQKVKEGEELRLFALLFIAESIVDEELWRIEEALLEVAKELPEDEKKHLKQLLEDSKKSTQKRYCQSWKEHLTHRQMKRG